MKMIFSKSMLLLLILSLLLCGCSQREETSSTDAPMLSQSTDYELLCEMAKNESVLQWSLSSYRGDEDELTSLMIVCPEFAELMSRETGKASFMAYKDEIEEQYPNCMFGFIEPYFG